MKESTGFRVLQVLFGLLVVAIWLAVMFNLFARLLEPARPAATTAQAAWSACLGLIERRAGLRPADAQDFVHTGVRNVGGNSYSVNVRYPSRGASYNCQILLNSSGDGELIRTDLGP